MAERKDATGATPGPWVVVSSWEGYTRADAYVHRKRADDLAAWHNRQSGHASVVVSAKQAAAAPALVQAMEEIAGLLAPDSGDPLGCADAAYDIARAALAASKGGAA